MEFSRLHVVFFSPTQSTKRLLINLTSGLNYKDTHTDLIDYTRRIKRSDPLQLESTELLVAGVPVHGGRMPLIAPSLFQNVSGDNTPAILVVTYGNRGFDDALLELKETLDARGFVCVAAAAMPVRHVFSAVVGSGRPDATDRSAATAFGRQIRNKLDGGDMSIPNVPGNSPYKPAPTFPYACPTTNQRCTHCNACYRWCPMDAIPYYDPTHTDAALCIRCHCCIRRCPIEARENNDPIFKEGVAKLDAGFASVHNEPQFFL